MQIYLYCSYERSAQGFFMTRVQNDGLVAQDINALPKTAYEFFFVDRFQTLWTQIPAMGASWYKPQVSGAFFGMRNIRGAFRGGRNGSVNVGFYVPANELQLLHRVALCILKDVGQFRAMLLSSLSVGGQFSYELDMNAFHAWFTECSRKSVMRVYPERVQQIRKIIPGLQRTEPAVYDTELLRLGVTDAAWKDVKDAMGTGFLWRSCPECVLTQQDFERAFVGWAPLWEMSEA